jgi:glycosyltransferase involved in cell wall biosynthesis
VGGFPDLVVPGQTGYLVPPKQPVKLAEAIVSVLKNRDEGRHLAANGRAWVCRHCDVRGTARQIYDIYGKIVSR